MYTYMYTCSNSVLTHRLNANRLQTLCTCMNSFFPFFRQEAAIHSASLVYLHYLDPHAILPLLFIKNSRLDHRFKKFCVLYMCFPMCVDERYCSPNVYYRLVPPLRTLKVTLSFPAKDTWALRISLIKYLC